mgnify:CR=1 FL=1|jgi:hypothetical protein
MVIITQCVNRKTEFSDFFELLHNNSAFILFLGLKEINNIVLIALITIYLTSSIASTTC